MEMEKMTLRQKVGQLFMIQPDALEGTRTQAELDNVSADGAARVSGEMREAFQEYPCGGFVLFRKNILGPDQLRSFTRDLHALGKYRPLLAIDEEGGRVARIGGHPVPFGVRQIPPMQEIGESGEEARAFEAGKTIGAYLRAFGLDIDFAPVADVNTNPQNVVIGNRAFGSDPQLAARMVAQVVDGLHEGGVISCVKHFPGHGDTAADTHTGYAETKKTWEEIRSCEMIPFRAGIAAGTEMIMAAHIAAPRVTGCEEPASLSRLLLTEKLRGEMGFEGVVITDALAMGAIREKYSSPEACLLALRAGVDILLMPFDYFAAFDGVMKAVEEGAIPERRIDESVQRIVRLKQALRAE